MALFDVPKDPVENIRFRRRLLEQCAESEKYAQDTWTACSRDYMFWINSFVWAFDPRPGVKHPCGPFITYPYQDEALPRIFDSIDDGRDLVIEKARDMGATWMVLLVYTYKFLFERWRTFLCVSRKEDYVDKAVDPDSLFWKIDFVLAHLPVWMKPEPHPQNRQKLHFHNPEMNNTIDGQSTTGDVGAGGRRTSAFFDEFARVAEGFKVLAATADVTPSRIFASTPQGRSGAYYVMRKRPGVRLITLDWWQHPIKARGLYRSDPTSYTLLDKEFKGNVTLPTPEGEQKYQFPKDYPFHVGDKARMRAPWFDSEVLRRQSPREIAQEIEHDYIGSGSIFFDGEVLARLEAETVRPPFQTGTLKFTDDRTAGKVTLGAFEPGRYGPLKLWCNLDASGKPPDTGKYVVGVDISTGTGQSNSVICAVDSRTGEKILEWADAGTTPEDLVPMVVAICRWLGTAYLIWDGSGCGLAFGKIIYKTYRYRRVYFFRNARDIKAKRTGRAGWYSTGPGKMALLTDYRKALADGAYINRSREALWEHWGYVYQGGNKVGFDADTEQEDDPSGAGENHGDRVIADALCVLGMGYASKARKPTPKIREGTFAWRQRAGRLKQRTPAGSW